MKPETVKKIEQEYNRLTSIELMLIISTQCLTYASHTQEYVDSQREIINLSEVRPVVKEILEDILSEVNIKSK